MNSSSRNRPLVQKSKPKVCVSIARQEFDTMFSDAKRAFSAGADLVELRLDYLQSLDLQTVKRKFKGMDNKLILTLRKKEEGGKFQGDEDKRIQLLRQIQSWESPYKDIELSTVSRNKVLLTDSASTIVSWHDFDSTPSKSVLLDKLSLALKYGGIAKIVTTAKALQDNITVLSLYNKDLDGKLVAFCMGEQGRVSRIIAPLLGSPFMYGCLGAAVAPGQIPISELRGFYELFEMA